MTQGHCSLREKRGGGILLGACAVIGPGLDEGCPGLALPGVGRGEEEGPHGP